MQLNIFAHSLNCFDTVG